MTEGALQAVQADAVTGDKPVTIPLHGRNGDVKITVPHPMDWDAEGQDMLVMGRFYAWAELCLSDKDFEAWSTVRPSNRDVEAFFTAWSALTGQSPGKSGPSANSSRSTRRR